jgi:tetratricopeptide (TPR) repeat protein
MGKGYLVLFLLLLMGACSSKGKVKISSLPEGANVSVKHADGSFKSIGVTPIEVSQELVFSAGSTMSTLQFEKEGFQDQSVFLGDIDVGANYDINLKLQKLIDDNKVSDLKNKQERMAQQLVYAHNLIIAKKYPEAQAILKTVSKDFPHVSVSYDLLGNIAYLQKDLNGALNYYQRSLEINPDNDGARQMVNRLQTIKN